VNEVGEDTGPRWPVINAGRAVGLSSVMNGVASDSERDFLRLCRKMYTRVRVSRMRASPPTTTPAMVAPGLFDLWDAVDGRDDSDEVKVLEEDTEEVEVLEGDVEEVKDGVEDTTGTRDGLERETDSVRTGRDADGGSVVAKK
jgi:hypothetical protein